MEWLDRIPFAILVAAALFIGLAPIYPEPHVVEKFRMLVNGTLRRPIDIFDLFFHLFPLILLIAKLLRKTAAN
ncbi:MAG: RND transporter [Desulfobulbaceae bacterium]|jgi:hypothetical protein|nr:RND transporter [Desulfobulbaceae bacterium]MDY0350884.1 RND transporter [Desulfobulbaceae bacterium]